MDKETEKKLQKLADEPCERYTQGNCIQDPGKSAVAPYLADRYCSPCRIKAALQGHTGPKESAVTVDNVLDLEGQFEYEGPVTTIRAYFQKMIFTLWEDPESFTGKRPFGDSGWVYPIVEVVEEATNLNETEVRILISKALTKIFD